MSYVSFGYFAILLVTVLLYYGIPVKARWLVLLAGSLFFYVQAVKDVKAVALFLGTGLISYFGGIVLKKHKSKLLLWFFCLASALPLLASKLSALLGIQAIHGSLVIPLGLSFYSLQMIAYLADVYKGKIKPRSHVLKYLLFISFFPQIIQGPIPRYDQLYKQVTRGHRFDERCFVKGLHLLLWGLFLKIMVADRLAVIVNPLFNEFPKYQGMYALLAGVLYTVQLYTDFLSCFILSKGSAALFGIHLADNFNHPYMATSIADFWRRWHMSLSSWLRDYVYIPLGGSRKGRVRKDFNILVTFLISGLWHGGARNVMHFIAWGLMHAIYQIAGGRSKPLQDKAYDLMGMQENSLPRLLLQRITTFLLVSLAFIMFRADSVMTGIKMIASIFTTWNPWIWFDDSLLSLGLEWKELFLLTMTLLVMAKVFHMQTKTGVSDWILSQHIWIRWNIYLIAIAVIWIFGVYGKGYDAAAFIYGGF